MVVEDLTGDLIILEETPERVERYEFDADFQQRIAALIMRDTKFAQLTEGLIRPEFFENTAFGALVRLSSDYYSRYKKSPGDKVIMASLLKEAIRTKRMPIEILKLATSSVNTLMATDVSDRDYVADECATFALHQAVAAAILESVTLVEKRDFGAVGIKIRKALDTGISISSGYNYGEMSAVRTKERVDRAAGILPATGVTTGHAVLDNCLYHKGWGRKELAVLMGAAKSGKSMAMLGFGVSAVAAGYRTLYVTLEVSKEIIAERVDANIASRCMSDLGVHMHEVQEKVDAFMAKSAPFIIEEYPTGSMRPSDLSRLIEKYKSQGVIFDLVIVDYADLMAPERTTDNVQENSKSVYINLRGLAMQEGFAMLTATQTNREGAKKAVATATDVAEDFNKIRIADIVISINKTPEEAKLGEARLFFAACRNQRSQFTLKIKQNIEQAKFITSILGED